MAKTKKNKNSKHVVESKTKSFQEDAGVATTVPAVKNIPTPPQTSTNVNGNAVNGTESQNKEETRDSLLNESSSENQENKVRKYYRKLKFKNESYILGDNIHLKDDEGHSYYGKITKIFASWEDEGYDEIRNEPVFEILW